ncbi:MULTISPECIES: maleate cis-trans isomerase family protein [Grimontia]|uniref:Maleate isomerase n=1 Tax=Grimontia marina TaxID=646534 RepID=A0A128EZM8_9GAMM|nr:MULTISPECIES: Asp/Glu racemase [Grimontia]WRV99711.1 Asp/Glu racemase [Grimontia sp. NTOU-MAR1]CZF80013.1 Maleate isomerase [Grimontia marina]
MTRTYKIGQIVPSSNLTMEREIPAMLRVREKFYPETFSFHSSRMRMKHVTPEELKSMDSDSDRCALELSDADVDVMGYACLVAIMAQGNGYHRESQKRLHEVTLANGYPTPIVSSAGALIDCLKLMDAKRISLITPYMKPLTKLVCDYIEYEGIEVHDAISLEIPNNLEVAAQDPFNLVDIYKRLDLTGIDVLVLSACVQMPSLAAIQIVEDECGIPVISAAVATTHQILTNLGLEAKVPGCGKLLS